MFSQRLAGLSKASLAQEGQIIPILKVEGEGHKGSAAVFDRNKERTGVDRGSN